MSIYSTLWILKFPDGGDYHSKCGWVSVIAQGVESHIGSTDGKYGDEYSSFLPPAIPEDESQIRLRAVVFVTESTRKGTERSAQEYSNPLLVLSGQDYADLSFEDLHELLCSALRGNSGRLVAEVFDQDGSQKLIRE